MTRIAKLILTDGKNSIQALEDKPIKIDKFGVGMLIEINIPCEVRHGILLLTNENTKLVFQSKELVSAGVISKV